MAAVLASAGATLQTGGTTTAPVAPTDVQAGDILLALHFVDVTNVTFTTPAGWNLVGTATGGAAFWKVATATDAGAAFTLTRSASSNGWAIILRITGALPTAPFANFAFYPVTTGVATSTGIILPSINATAGNTLIHVPSEQNATVTLSPPAGVTKVSQTASNGSSQATVATGQEPVTTTGAQGTNTWTTTNGGTVVGFIAEAVDGGDVTSLPGNFKITYRASNTFTVPAGVTSVQIEAQGSGGNGGGGALLTSGGGGGGGAYARTTLAVTAGQTLTITVGTQPAAPASAVAGVAGAASLVARSGTTVAQAGGGGGGGLASTLGTGSAGAAGTAATGADARNNGTAGVGGGAGGAGGGVLGGAGGAAGAAGGQYGGGGGGGTALGGRGGQGGPGVVVITFQYVTDTIATTDSRQLVVTWNRAQNESVAVLDQIAQLILRPIAESVTTSDNNAKLYYKDSNAEILSATDAYTRALRFLEIENLSATDVVVQAVRHFRVESVTATDFRVTRIARMLTESVSAQDFVRQYLRRPLIESVTATDFALVVLIYLRYANDTATALDQIRKYDRLAKTDAVLALDVNFKLVVKRPTNDVVTTSDLVTLVSTYRRSPADSVLAIDTLARRFRLLFQDSISGNATGPVTPVTGRRRIFVLMD